ncbi:MAG: hypothetical protein JXR14_15845 [Paracoccaceae bacterium]
MLNDTWFRVGLIGLIITLVLKMTPLGVIALSALGLSGLLLLVDTLLLPGFILSVGIMIAAVWRRINR